MIVKRYVVLVLAGLVLTGCQNQPEPYPSGRMMFENTGISFITPDAWYRTRIPGSTYETVYTAIHYDIKPNIQLEMYEKNPDVDSAVGVLINKKKDTYPNYNIKRDTPFVTDDGITGRKITAQRDNDKNISIIHFHYIFTKKDDVYILTATCAEPGIGKYEALFDLAMKSVEIRN